MGRIQCTIKSVIDVDKKTVTSCACIYDWNSSYWIECPFAHTTSQAECVEIDIIFRQHEKTTHKRWINWNTSCWVGIFFRPYNNTTCVSIRNVNGIICSNKNCEGMWTDCTGISKSCCISIPWCIWTKSWLIIRNSYKKK